MPNFTEGQLQELRQELNSLAPKYNQLLIGYTRHAYRTAKGRQFAVRGFVRRADTLKHAIFALFDQLPPEFEDIPDEGRRKHAEIIVQTFVIHLFGSGDNLARVWVEEAGITTKEGAPLPSKWIGLGSKYTTLRNALPDSLQQLLTARHDWFVYMESLRHALAHRVPLYIPPYAVEPKNKERYLALDGEMQQAMLRSDLDAHRALEQQQRELTFFRPWVVQEDSPDDPLIKLHPQMLADFNTIHELGLAFLAALPSA